MKFEAGLQGIDLDKEIKGQQTIKTSSGEEITVSKDFLFGDPKDYEKMTPEERNKKTEEMMGMHRKVFGRRM